MDVALPIELEHSAGLHWRRKNDTRSIKPNYVSSAMRPGIHKYDFWNKVRPGQTF